MRKLDAEKKELENNGMEVEKIVPKQSLSNISDVQEAGVT